MHADAVRGNPDTTTTPVTTPEVTGAGRLSRRSTRRRRPAASHLLLAGMSLAAGLAVVVAHLIFFRHFSGDSDEGVYVLQSQMLAAGRLTLPASHAGFFQPWLTGVHDGQIFTQYLPAWPGLLAAASTIFGTATAAPVIVAMLLAPAVYGLASELLGERRTALLAAGLATLCPLLLVHATLFLAYGFVTVALTGAAAAGLRGMRTGGRWWLLASGAAAGLVLLTRPLDLLLFGTPVAVLALVKARRAAHGRAGARRAAHGRAGAGAGWFALGFAPLAVLLFVYNARVTGSPFLLPIPASEPSNALGFGDRRLVPGMPIRPYRIADAVHALRTNLTALPGWLFGGVALVLAAVAGAVRRGPRRAERACLALTALAFPVGYFFWWGTAPASEGAANGIGPHYYVPAAVPVAVMAADGVRALWRALHARTAVPVGAAAVGAVVVAVTLTAVALPDKVSDQNDVNARYDAVSSALASVTGPAVVVVSTDPDGYVGQPFAFLANPPDLRAATLYAAELGAAEHRLPELPAAAGRRLYRLTVGPDGSAGVTELHAVSTSRLAVRVLDPGAAGSVTAWLTVGGRTVTKVLERPFTPGKVYRVVWNVPRPALDTVIVVGAAVGDVRVEQHISAGPDGGRTSALLPGVPWQNMGAGWERAPRGPALEVSACPEEGPCS